jgi:hypothetical protein
VTEEETMNNIHYSKPRSNLDNQYLAFEDEVIRFVKVADPQERKIESAADWFFRGMYTGGIIAIAIFALIIMSGVLG